MKYRQDVDPTNEGSHGDEACVKDVKDVVVAEYMRYLYHSEGLEDTADSFPVLRRGCAW